MMRLKKCHGLVYMRELLRQPAYASLFAAFVTLVFIHIKSKIQGVDIQKNSVYFKPAMFNALLVYGIVHFGQLE